jgi:hypothetical protein
MLEELFDTCCAEVESGYESLGHTLGYRFLTGPRATLAHATQIALITLNPGGGADSANQSGGSFEEGSSYVSESWLGQPAGRARLQLQIQALFREIKAHAGFDGLVEDFLAAQVLTAHFIPFRSPSFKELKDPENSLEFGKSLWSRILLEWRPRLVVTIDREAFFAIGQVITKLGGRIAEYERFPTGWGIYSCDASRYDGFRKDEVTVLARLPHLSRFTLFSEPGYSGVRKAAMQPFFSWITAHLR